MNKFKIILVLSIAFLSSCTKPQEVVDAEEAISYIDSAQQVYNKEKEYYNLHVKKHKQYKDLLKIYDNAEGWESAFKKANLNLTEARSFHSMLLKEIDTIDTGDSIALNRLEEKTENMLDKINNCIDIVKWPRIQAQKVLETYSASNTINSSYAKILADQRIRYFVYIGRTSWDESSDSNTDIDYAYPKREIDEKTYLALQKWEELKTDYWDSNEVAPLATLYAGWGNDNLDNAITKPTWDALHITPKEKWPNDRHDRAEYYVTKFELLPEHQYIYEKDGTFDTKQSWENVTLPYYYAHIGDLGMQIAGAKKISKDSIQLQTSTVPAGFNYVGDQNYGSWGEEKDSITHTFHRVWHYYPRYYYYSSYYPRSYSYDQYSYWKDNHPKGAGYYGNTLRSKNEIYGTYGSSNTQKKYGTRFKRTHLYNQQRNSFKQSSREIGPKFRNRGPGVGK